MLPAAGMQRGSRYGGGHRGPTAGLAPGFVQGNLAILPAPLASDFLRFCQFNPKPCQMSKRRSRNRRRMLDLPMAEGIELRHIARGRNVTMYRTSIAAHAAGPFHGPMVVSMRPLRPADAIRAVQITTRFPAVHGAPVHIGKPELIGIADLMKPDYGDAVPVNDDELPVFWACGVTPQSLIATVRPEFCITGYPGSMLVNGPKEFRNSRLCDPSA